MSTLAPHTDPSKTRETEAALLGILLFQPQQIQTAIRSGLEPRHFVAPQHDAILEALRALDSDGETVTPVSVYARMAAQGNAARLDALNGEAYLVELQNACNRPEGLPDLITAVCCAANEREQKHLRETLARDDLPADRRAALRERLRSLSAERDELLCAAEGWKGDPSPPIPLEDGSVPEWPAGVLPSPIGEYVEAVAESIQIPRDLAAMVALGFISSCWAGKVRAGVTAQYREELSLYGIAVADVGERKSACFARFEDPARAYEKEQRAALDPLRSDYAAERAGLEAELEKALRDRKSAKHGSPEYEDAKERARERRRQLDALRPPPRAEFIAQDCTAEGLARFMSETGGFAALLSPEGGGIFENMAGHYSDVPNLDIFLKGYDGERLVIHRANREREPPPIERPALVMAVTTQPGTLRTLVANQALDERGLVARMIFALPSRSRVGYREAFRPAVPDDLCSEYHQIMLSAYRVERPAQPHELGFSAEALTAYREMYDAHERRLRPDGDLYPIRGWANKLVGKIVRIAALFHLMEHAGHVAPWMIPVAGATFQRAAQLADYLSAHALRAFDVMRSSPSLDQARRLRDALQRANLRRFTTREAQRLIARNGNKAQLRPALDVLHAHNFIARTASRRHDSEAWTVNPRWARSWEGAPSAPRSREGRDRADGLSDAVG